MVRYYTRYHSEATIFRLSSLVNLKDGVEFAMLFTLKTTRKAGGLQILCCQGFAVADYSFTLDALALKPSGFCNVRVHLPALNENDAHPAGVIFLCSVDSWGRSENRRF